MEQEKQTIQKNVSDSSDSFDLQAVPLDKRQTPTNMAFIFLAWTCTLNCALVGAAVGSQATFKNAIYAIIVACILLIAIGSCYGLIGQRTGLGTGNLCRYAFGLKGSNIPSFFSGTAMLGWLAFDIWTGASIVSSLFPGGHSVFGFFVGAFCLALIAAVGAYVGITGIKWISWGTVPVAIVLFVIIIVASINRGGGMDAMLAYRPPVETPFFIVVNLTLGVWINGTALYNDMTRMGKNHKAVFVSVFTGVAMVAFLLLVGVTGMIGLKAYGIAALGLSLGGVLFIATAIFSLIAMANTAPASDYIAAQSCSSILHRNRQPFCIILAVVSVIIASLIEFVLGIESINQFVSILATFMPPIIGVVLVDYWIINKGTYPQLSEITLNYSASGIISFAGGSGVALYFTFINPFGLPSLFGIVVAAILQLILKKGFRMK